MIPKTIHYCWFGRNPKPKLAEKCIKSWQKYCPDYEIIEWNEDNFDIGRAPLYVKQAYDAKKWAFVTDYVRLWAMITFGGVYMDTDVEVVKPLDIFLTHQAFSGFENENRIPTGIMACEKGFPLFHEFLQHYETAKFIDEYGNTSTVTNVKIMTDICLKKGLQLNNTLQTVEGLTLYPKDVFCPYDWDYGRVKKTKRTATIHWFAGSWLSDEQKDRNKKAVKAKRRGRRILLRRNIIKRLLGVEGYERLKKIVKGK